MFTEDGGKKEETVVKEGETKDTNQEEASAQEGDTKDTNVSPSEGEDKKD